MFKRVQGVLGSVVIPSIGLTIGTMSTWSLNRRGDTTPDSGEWDFHAYFSYLNETAWNSDSWDKEIQVIIGAQKTGQKYRVSKAENGRTVLEGNALIIEGANLDVI